MMTRTRKEAEKGRACVRSVTYHSRRVLVLGIVAETCCVILAPFFLRWQVMHFLLGEWLPMLILEEMKIKLKAGILRLYLSKCTTPCKMTDLHINIGLNYFSVASII